MLNTEKRMILMSTRGRTFQVMSGVECAGHVVKRKCLHAQTDGVWIVNGLSCQFEEFKYNPLCHKVVTFSSKKKNPQYDRHTLLITLDGTV